MNRIAAARREVARYEPRLQQARAELHEAIREAASAGVDVKLIAEVAGISRQRVAKILKGE
jgi:uncharacterized protein (UPF0335 family)